MLNFVKSLSKNYKSFKFYFRIHPLMKIDKYKKVTNYKNIIISKILLLLILRLVHMLFLEAQQLYLRLLNMD